MLQITQGVFMSRMRRLIVIQALACIGLLFSTVQADGRLNNQKLNRPLQPAARIVDLSISADGKWIVYRADAERDEVYELYAVPTSGPVSATVKLNATLPSGGIVDRFTISPDSKRVVYQANQTIVESVELYSAPIAQANAAVKLNGAMAEGGRVRNFTISPDGRRVVYVANQDNVKALELYSAPIATANAAVKLNGALVEGGRLYDFIISPDSGHVVYRAYQDNANALELYSAPIATANAAVKLHSALVEGRKVYDYEISPDSGRVIYLADQETALAFELYSAPIATANAAVKLNGKLASVRAIYGFTISSDSRRVIYRATEEKDLGIELYSAPIATANAAVKLNRPLETNRAVFNYRISPDSRRVVYTANQDTQNVFELYSAPIAGDAAAVKLNGAIAGEDGVYDYRISPDSGRVVYKANQDADRGLELYSAPIATANAAVKLGSALRLPVEMAINNANITLKDEDEDRFADFRISPDSSRVVYLAEQDSAEVVELYSAPIAGGVPSVKLNNALVNGSQIDFFFRISPDSRRVAYQAGLFEKKMLAGESTPVELYSAPIATANAAVKLNGALVSGRNVNGFAISTDSRQVFYAADQDTDNLEELYVTSDTPPRINLAGSTTPVSEATGTVTLTVTLSQTTVLAPVQVKLDAGGGSATRGVDYTFEPQTLNFEPGTTSQSVTVPLLKDTLVEGNETIIFTLSDPSNGTVGAGAVTLTLTDPDSDDPTEPLPAPGAQRVYLPLTTR
jgi:Tol biopolymer transport system component